MRHSGEHPRPPADHLTIVHGARPRRSKARKRRAGQASFDAVAPIRVVPPPVESPPAPRRQTGARADTARQAFGSRLRTARARAGLTLQTIAGETKVSASTFAALEEGDISRWPRGLYRRSFFRQYVEALGLPMDETCAEFEQVFADELVTEVSEPEAPPTQTRILTLEHPAIRLLLAVAEWLTRKLSVA